ncbi:MAG: MFS transporter, partial [Halobacteriales archaeon]|nr:MFS transporter [Halobacteriales archaeon]
MSVGIGSIPSAVRHRLANGPLYYGWVVVGACFAIHVITWGTVWSFGVFFAFLVEEFGLSNANTSIVFSLQAIVTFGSAAGLGLVIDRYGSRRLLVLATVLITVGLLGVSRLPSFLGVMVSYSLVAALGFGIAAIIAYVAPVRWFERRRGLATGIATAGAGVGILVVSPLVEWAIGQIGWRATYAGLTAGFVILFGFAILVFADRPRDVGSDPSAEFTDGAPDTDPVEADWQSQVEVIAGIARSRTFVLVILAYLFLSAPMAALLVNAVEYTTSVGIGRATGVLAIGVLGAMNVVGKVAGGPVVDRFGPARTIAASGVFEAVGLAVVLAVPSPEGVVVGVVIFGFG